MPKFIRTNNGLINLDHVVSIREVPEHDIGQVEYAVLYDKEDRALGNITQVVYNRYLCEDYDAPVTAPPGWFMVYICHGASDDGDGCIIEELPVIAFCFGESDAIPFTAAGRDVFTIHNLIWAIKQPDGRIISIGGQSWDSIDKFKADGIALFKELEEIEQVEQARQKPKLVPLADGAAE